MEGRPSPLVEGAEVMRCMADRHRTGRYSLTGRMAGMRCSHRSSGARVDHPQG
jgi:hypothetical protein